MKTWRDIEERAIYCPFYHQAVHAVNAGHATREEALIIVTLGLSAALAGMKDAVTDYVSGRSVQLIAAEKVLNG